ncbi:MAG: hypothetical protein JNM95_13530, partial [Chitinophagaceae bacterium]|nr:hypothetical protein [Chitinophagaceae bacterium]
STFAQVPQKFNYQGVARTEQGDPIKNQNLKLKIAVLPTDDATVSEYEEIQTVKTNEFGLYTLQIGNGEAVLGDMKTVKWETGNKYIRVAIDPKGGNDFTVIGTSQLLSVPYAIYADKAGQARETVGGHTGDTRSGAVSTSATGTGTVNYLTKFTAANTIYNSQIFDNGTNIGIGTAAPLSRMHITTSAGNQEHLRMENLSSTSWGKFIFYNDVNANYHTFTKYGSAVAGNYGGASTLFPYANLLVFGSNNSPTVMANGHNIGFATVNGGTAYFKFIGMQSTGNVGLGGNSTPITSIHINRTDATGDTVKITNNTTGHTATDGLDIRTTGNTAQIINRESSTLAFGTNNTVGMTMDASNNVGIGTTTPSAKLDVNSTTNYPMRVNGTSPMYMGLYESGSYRGYLGSYSGNATDVDFGTGAGNTTGAVHLTLQATPKLTVASNGNVGLNNTNPASRLTVGNEGYTGSQVVHFYDTTNTVSYVQRIDVTDAYGLFVNKTGLNEAAYISKDNTGSGTSSLYVYGNMSAGTPALTVTSGNNDAAQFYGSLTVTDGSQGAGKVFTSDASGKGTWKNGIYSSPWMTSSSLNSSDTTVDGTCVRARYLSAPEITAAVLNGAMIVTYFRVGSIGPYQLPYTSDAGGATNQIHCFYNTGKICVYRHTFNTCRFNSGIPEAYPGQPVMVNLPNSLEYRYVIYYNE